jgi:hypothetical protein
MRKDAKKSAYRVLNNRKSFNSANAGCRKGYHSAAPNI